MNTLEVFSAVMGLLGALLLAVRSRYAGWAFVAWMFSNIGWIVFGTGQQHWFLVVQQAGFLIASALGIWKWLLAPIRLPADAPPPSQRMTTEHAQKLLRLIQYPGYTFKVVGDRLGPAYLQASFVAPCNVSGGLPVQQTTRKWRLSQHMTASELVQTALKCVLTSIEHEAREQFRYRGAAIFGPHFDVDRLVALCEHGAEALEVRP